MGCSQETLAAMLYMKKTTICRYEKDEHDIPVSVIVELAKALQTTPNDLLMGNLTRIRGKKM
nr:helix-turn-helix transcriptional regulator [Suipraeoptans intestinalis]